MSEAVLDVRTLRGTIKYCALAGLWHKSHAMFVLSACKSRDRQRVPRVTSMSCGIAYAQALAWL